MREAKGKKQKRTQPAVGALRVVDGERVEDAAPYAVALTPPSNAARSRAGERIFILLDLSDAVTHLGHKLREVIAQTYWSSSGSITSALRRAATAANRYLFHLNLNAAPAERCYGGLTCAVFHDDDLFILQTGPAWACFLQGNRLTSFPRDEKLAHLGIGPLADVRLYHVFPSVHDTLMIAAPVLAQQVDESGLASILPRPDLEDMLDGVEQVGGGIDFAALVVRWEPEQETARESLPSPPPEAVEPSSRGDVPRIIGQQRPEKDRQGVEIEPVHQMPERRKPPRKLGGPTPGERIASGVRWLGRGLGYVKRGLAAIGAGLLTFGKWLVGLLGGLFRQMLPGPERVTCRQERARPVPQENRTLMMALAFGIPVLVIIVVVLARLRFGAASRFRQVMNQAKEEAALAQEAQGGSEEARTHWESALALADAAATLQPDNQAAATLHDQAQTALDRAEGVRWLTSVQLVDFGSSNPARRLIAHGQVLFVLDPTDGWAAQVSLNQAGDDLAEDDTPPIIAHTGKQVGADSVGELVDCVWMDQGAGRQTSDLLILEADGALLNYDPAWTDAAGHPQVKRSFLGTPPRGTPQAVGSYQGRFYVLDATADGSGQIWRYRPEGDAYPNQPERYFVNPPSKSLADALDMAIDGHIYVLYTDGTILKFLGGEAQPFDVHGVPGGFGEVVAFALGPDGSGAVYVADRGNDRVVKLGPEGAFQMQFRADEAFDDLEALAVSETAQYLYVLSGGRIYAVMGLSEQ